MDDMDMMAAMGIAGFGKKQKQRLLDPKRFEKNRREEVRDPFMLPEYALIYASFRPHQSPRLPSLRRGTVQAFLKSNLNLFKNRSSIRTRLAHHLRQVPQSMAKKNPNLNPPIAKMMYRSFPQLTNYCSRITPKLFPRWRWIHLELGLLAVRRTMTASYGISVEWIGGVSLSKLGNPRALTLYAQALSPSRLRVDWDSHYR